MTQRMESLLDKPSYTNNILPNMKEPGISFIPEFRKPNDKPSNGTSTLRSAREVNNSSAPEMRRSRSTPRGKFMV